MMFYSLSGAEGQTRSNIPLWHVHLCKTLVSILKRGSIPFPMFPFCQVAMCTAVWPEGGLGSAKAACAAI